MAAATIPLPLDAPTLRGIVDAQREHKAMVTAIRRADRKALVELCAHHLDISRNAYIDTHRLRYAPTAKPSTHA